MKRIVMMVWAVGLMVGWAQAQLGGLMPKTGKTDGSGLEITAEKFEVDQKTGWTTASGKVMIRTGSHELKADRVRLHQDKGDVRAFGNVFIQQTGFGSWSGDYIEYNFKTGKGLTGSGDFQAGVFRVRGNEVTRREDGRYDLKGAVVTTCTNAPGHEHWRMTGRARFKDNDYVEIFDAVPWMFGVPFAYLPYWYRDLDTHYGFRLVPGYTSRWGAFVLGGYVYNIYESPRADGPKLDGQTHLDYRTERGVAVGQDFSWDVKDFGRGKLETYYAWDQNPSDDPQDLGWMSAVNEDRYRIRLRHEADLSPRDQFLLRGTYTSDSEMSREFFDREHRGESVPMNFASLEHREHTWASGVMASGPINDFFGGVSRLPEGWLNIEPQPVFGTGLNYESQTRAGYLDRDPVEYSRLDKYRFAPGEWADYNIARVDTAHRLTYPMKFGDVLSVVPRAGYRGTYYSETELNNNVFRHSADLGVEASMRATSDWNNGVRHVMEPYVDYSYQPTRYDFGENGRVFAFDRFDRSFEWADQLGFDGTWLPYDWHGVRPGVRNLFQKRDENNVMRTFLDWDVYAGAQFNSTGNLREDGLRMAGTKLLYSPTKKLDLRAHADWDTEASTVAYADLSAFYKITDKFRMGGGYLGRDHRLFDYQDSLVDQWNRMKENLLYGGFTHDINDTWSWSFYTRYDLRHNELAEVGGYVQYSLDCLVFQLRSSYVNNLDRIDRTEGDSDFRVALVMWLKAEKRSSRDEWLTW